MTGISRRELLMLAATTPLARAQFRSSVQVVNVFVTVRDKEGELVRGLTQADFELTEDGRKQNIQYFAAESDLPLTLGLVFDLSGSQRTVLEQQRRASVTFLNQVLRDGDSAFLMGFDQRVKVLEPLGPSRILLRQGLADLEIQESQSRGTALFDAIAQAADLVKAEPGRKALIVLSDGIDTASSSRAEDAIAAAQRADTLVYPIRFFDQKVFAFDVPGPGTENLRQGKRVLQKIAKETGGGFYEVAGARTLADNFAHLEQELRNQYSLGFSPREGRPGYRKVRVTVKSKGLRTQARDGYFAQ
ncbi:MAG: VWA domain-containing protein [Acidobacteriota bacterium]